MQSILETLPRAARVTVIRLRSMGDCVLTTPAIHILKIARPDLRIAVVVEERFRGVFEDNSDVEALLAPDYSAIWRWRPTLCLNLHGGARSAGLTGFSGARLRAGFGHFRYAWLYNIHIPRAQQILGEERTVHTAEHLASAMFYLGAPRIPIPRARLFAEIAPDSGPYAAIHPFASAASKSWRSEGFGRVADHLRQSGLEPVIIGGPADDFTPFGGCRSVCGAPLSKLKALIRGASMFVGNDSGPAHIAAAFGVPVVVLFGSSDPAIWGPWQTSCEVLASPNGIAGITEVRVLEALERVRVHA